MHSFAKEYPARIDKKWISNVKDASPAAVDHSKHEKGLIHYGGNKPIVIILRHWAIGNIHWPDIRMNIKKLTVAMTYLSHDAAKGSISLATTLPAGQPRPHMTATEKSLR